MFGEGKLLKLKRKKDMSSTVDKEAQDKNEKSAVPARAKNVAIAPVLTFGGKKGSISDGCVLLSNSYIVDLEAAEGFRILRAKIERRALTEGRQTVIAITSAVPGEGKSVIAVNLARAFGMDPQGKTLIVDCDLRKPNVHRFFGESVSPGLSDVLVAGKSVKSVIRSLEPGLDFIAAGSPVIDSTRTIEQPGFITMLEEMGKYYRKIVIDCPPVLLCSEPLFLVQNAHSAVMVIRAWRTQKKLVKEAVNVIGPKKIAGTVLNECADSLQQYGYYSYYGYNNREIAQAKLRRAGQFEKGGWFGKAIKQ